MIRIGVIGFGARAAAVVAALRQVEPSVEVAVVADPHPDGSRVHMARYEIDFIATTFVPDSAALLARANDLDGIVIATRCEEHAALAVQVARSRLPLFLEKPVGITASQLNDLETAFSGDDHPVVVSFPLRLSPLMVRVREIIASGRLGQVNQIQAFNNVPYGGVYFGQWFRDSRVTGDLWLQKATHDLDYLIQLAGAPPVSVSAMASRRIYGGVMPVGLKCSACDQTSTCIESPQAATARGDDGGMGRDDHGCPFGQDIRHHDAATALVKFSNGLHASYAQNFVSRRSAARRGARVTGYLATLEFDFCTETVVVIEHHGTAVDRSHVTANQGHHGGDMALARNFLDVMRGAGGSRAPLCDGILSARTCLALGRSEAEGRMVNLAEIDR